MILNISKGRELEREDSNLMINIIMIICSHSRMEARGFIKILWVFSDMEALKTYSDRMRRSKTKEITS